MARELSGQMGQIFRGRLTQPCNEAGSVGEVELEKQHIRGPHSTWFERHGVHDRNHHLSILLLAWERRGLGCQYWSLISRQSTR